jgi:hypothetical protein
MSLSSAAVPSAIAVLIADSNRMQAQLLTSALRRRSEFHISTCQVDIASILQAVTSTPAKVVVLSLNHSVNIAGQMAAMRGMLQFENLALRLYKSRDEISCPTSPPTLAPTLSLAAPL